MLKLSVWVGTTFLNEAFRFFAIEFPCPPQEPPKNPPTPKKKEKKIKFFIYYMILMKFETQHFYMLTNNNWDRYLWLGAPYIRAPPTSLPIHQGPIHQPPPLPLPQKIQILHLWCDLAEIWNGIFICHSVYQPGKPGEPGNLREFFKHGNLREF